MNIKGMDKNMRCRGFQFEIGKEYKKTNNEKELELCSDTVFHYCKTLKNVHKFYNCNNESNRFFEIEVLGKEITDGFKYGSDHIRIVREIPKEELNSLKGLDGTNAGLFNSGNFNSGNFNSGNFNSGDRNSGDCNSGNFNSGDCNSGNFNSGDCNSGNCNSGNFNSGNCNSGNFNSGFANKCDNSNGVFCNMEDTDIKIFNQPSGMSLKEFYESEYFKAITSAPYILTEYVKSTSDDNKDAYIKTYTEYEAWANWWEKLTYEAKEIIKKLPNFNPEIFKDITGIDVNK